MIKVDFYKDRAVGVLGLGLTGLATAEALLAGGAKVSGWDDNRATRKRALEKLPQVALLAPENKAWRGLDLFVPSPGISEKHTLIQDLTLLKVKMLGDVELFARAVQGAGAKVIAITGTNGKSTTTALTTHILKSAGLKAEMGGNIGVPLLALSPPDKDRIYVLEISSYQADMLETFVPDIAVQLNLTPDHTQRHGTLENYAAAKAKIFARMTRRQLALINTKDKFGKKLYKKTKAKKVELQKVLVPIKNSKGQENLAACYEIARACGVGDDLFIRAIKSFQLLSHRQELVATLSGIAFINDSKATNAQATKQALMLYDDIHWLAGGAAKEEGFAALENVLGAVRHAYLFGAAADKLGDFLQGKISFSKYKTLELATKAAIQCSKSGVVLLSPACASFDAFTDFAARGNAFSRAVRATQTPKVILAAGGTGGGLFPAAGLADALRLRGKETHLFHDKRAAAYLRGKKWADTERAVLSAPIAARSFLGLFSAAFWMALGVLQSLYFLSRVGGRGAKVIVGFGGYPSVPVLVAGVLLRIPFVLHEPGGVLGRANRTLLPWAKRLSLSVPLKTKAAKSMLVGNPVRPQIKQWQETPYTLPKSEGEPLRVLVFAGSQGAQWFDEHLPSALCAFAKTYGRPLAVVQQCRGDQSKIKKQYEAAGVACQLAPFFDNIASLMANAHLVIARAGASTISELSLLARPAILIPHQCAAPGAEQKANAENFVACGGGWLMEEGDWKPETFLQRLQKITTPGALAKAQKSLQQKNGEAAGAADKLAQLVLGAAHG